MGSYSVDSRLRRQRCYKKTIISLVYFLNNSYCSGLSDAVRGRMLPVQYLLACEEEEESTQCFSPADRCASPQELPCGGVCR